MAPSARWWEVRRAQSTKPASYTCPFCLGRLPALSEHMLLFPEGDHSRRRHAHSRCVMVAREAGDLPTRAEWQASQPSATVPRRVWWRRLSSWSDARSGRGKPRRPPAQGSR